MSGTSYGIGIDLGGTTFVVGVFDPGGKLVDEGTYDTPLSDDPERLTDTLARAARRQMGDEGAGLGNVVGVAVGFPGPVDPEAGTVKKAPNVPGLEGFPLTQALSERLDGVRVWLENDAYCATLAELRWGAGKDAHNLLMLTLGTGIGGGVALNDQVIRGPRRILGEIGHMVIDPAGRRCGCGNFGCLEAVAAKQAIIDMAARAIQSGQETVLSVPANETQTNITPRLVADAAQQGDRLALDIYQRVAFYIGVALCNAIVMCDPDLIILGGGIAAAGDVLFDPIRRTVRARSLISGFDPGRIVPARFGGEAGVYGAGALAWERA